MSNELQVKIIDKNTSQILYQFSFENIDKAYTQMMELEAMDLDVELICPSLPHTLLNSLGANSADQAELAREIETEIDSHESCCIEK